MRLTCTSCGKSVSTEVPEDTIVRAALECPECLQKENERMAKLNTTLREVLADLNR